MWVGGDPGWCWLERGEGEGSGTESPRLSGLELDDPAEIDERGEDPVPKAEEAELDWVAEKVNLLLIGCNWEGVVSG